MTLKTAPTPQKLADAWTRGFAAAVRDAAGKDKRLSKSEGKKVREPYADNVKNWFKATGQSSVSIEKVIGSGHAYAEATGIRVAGADGRISLKDAAKLPVDLKNEYFQLRGKAPASAATAPAALAKAATLDALASAALEAESAVEGAFEDGAHINVRRARATNLEAIEKKLIREGKASYSDEVFINRGKKGKAGVDDALQEMRSIVNDALTGTANDDAMASLDALRGLCMTYGDDVQSLSVSEIAGRESFDRSVLVLGLSRGKPILVELGS